MSYNIRIEKPAGGTSDKKRDFGNIRIALSRAGAAPRRCVIVLALTAVVAMLAGCNDDETLTETINRALQKTSIPGAIVGVWREGKPPYVHAFGVRDTATGEPMAADLYMRIGSNTKSFVVTSILILADRGELSLDDPIGLYVDGVPNGDLITLRQLGQMRSGLYDYVIETSKVISQQPFRQWTPQELLDLSFSHQPLFPPGSDFDYSNTNTVLLGLVVEKVSGQSLASFIGENILEPLGLTRTVFPAENEFPSPHSHGYYKLQDGEFVDATDWNPSWGWAAGNMISTLEDLRVWARALAVGKLISPAMKKEQHHFLPAPEEGEGARYGLALENQNGWLGHNGNILSYMAYPYYLPSERITLVLLLNTGGDIPGSWRMMQEITRIIAPDNPWPNIPVPEE